MGVVSAPKPPPAPAAPPTPISEDVRRRRSLQQFRRRQGRLSTIFTGPMGLANRGTIASPALLGGGGMGSTPMGG